MASILNKSPRTISTNIEMILDFFGVENQKELIIMHYRKLMNK
jgi:DNA-binding CsgD family transcriptional regulator